MGCEEIADRSDPEAALPCVGRATRRAIYGRLPGPSAGQTSGVGLTRWRKVCFRAKLHPNEAKPPKISHVSFGR